MPAQSIQGGVMKLAILGASGFIGSRAVEMIHLQRRADLRVIVRSFTSMAPLARFQLDMRVCDVLDEEKLAAELQGCNALVQCIVGDAKVILRSAEATFRACAKAGVSRLIYLSSTAVHGLAPPPGTDESSPLRDDQPFSYNNAKVKAEKLLLQLSQDNGPELVILRPGIVYGPRSARWSYGLAQDILCGRACLAQDGQGICNAIYVDNVIDAIMQALTATKSQVHRQAFLIGDAETVTWGDLYGRLAVSLGVDPVAIPRIINAEAVVPCTDGLRNIQSSPAVQTILPLLPGRLKRTLKAAAVTWLSPPPDAMNSEPSPPTLTAELSALQSCRWKLPHTKAQALLAYAPAVSFDEGCKRTAAWLQFAGFPVRNI